MGFLPREPGQRYTKKLQGEVMSAFGYLRRQKWTNALATSLTRLKTGYALAAEGATLTVFTAQPDFARQITLDPGGTTADVKAGNYVVNGTNIRDEVISDTIVFADNATAAIATVKAFKTVTSVVFPAQDGASSTWDIGINDALGLDRCMSANEVLRATMDGAIEATAPTVAFNATDVSKNVVTPNTALNAALDLAVVYIATETTSFKQTTA